MLIRLIRRHAASVIFALAFTGSLGIEGRSYGSEAADTARAHIAAGEFGPAAAIAAGLTGAEQDAVIQEISAARRQASSGQARSTEGTREAAPAQLSGTGADFRSLMNMIKQQTSEEILWQDDDGDGGEMTPFESGVRVDPKGVLSKVERRDAEGRLSALGLKAREADLNADVARQSELRMVSLTRLEREVADRLARGERVPDSMRQLAGLSEIKYVFVDADRHDIVIAGPAEGWSYTAEGHPVARSTGRPTLRLDDLVVVLRTFEPNAKQVFGCSIDPREEGLKAVKSFVDDSQKRGPLEAGQAKRWAQQIGEVLGRQDVTVHGIPADSRVARVIVEADYRMKLIGIDKLEAGKNIPSYFDLIAKSPSMAQGGLDALRWWLTLNTDEVLFSADHDAFEIKGASVKCLSENQFITSTGGRASSGKAEPVNRDFAERFTKNYAELAAAQPVFADLEGVFDLAMAAALIRHEGLDQKVEWNRGAFASDGLYQPAHYAMPKEVDSVVNHRVFNGKDVVVQVAGGVTPNILNAVSNPEARHESAAPAQAAEAAKASVKTDRWWWDVAR
jgi:hypothetical protein